MADSTASEDKQHSQSLDASRGGKIATAGGTIIDTQTYIEHQTINQIVEEVEPVKPDFQVPFPRNDHMVGREELLAELHARLIAADRRPIGLVGLGGIGKTQLAVEYAHRHRADYPGGVFWLNAAEDWLTGLKNSAFHAGARVPQPDRADASLRFVQALVEHLKTNADVLLILDTVEDPADLARETVQGFVAATLRCAVLFTTRRRGDQLPFQWQEVGALAEAAALDLLLYRESRRAARDPAHPEHAAARELCARLSYLPLCLAIAGAYLDRNLRVSLDGLRRRIKTEGALDALDANRLRPEDLPTGHSPLVAATLGLSWEALADEAARRVLMTAALLGEATQIPRARLALLSGLPDEAEPGYPSPLEDALTALREYSLIEELTADEVRLHPLVREFAAREIPDRAAFARAAAENLASALWDVARLVSEVKARGVHAVLADLRAADALSPTSTSTPTPPSPDALRQERGGGGVRPLLRALDLDAHILRRWNPETEPAFFLQQWRNRCFEMDWSGPQHQAETTLEGRRLPHLRELRRLGLEDAALQRTLQGHTSLVEAVAISPDGRWLASGSVDNTVRLWDAATGALVANLVVFAPVLCCAFTPDGHRIAGGDRLGGRESIKLATAVQPDEQVDLSVDLKAPSNAGSYKGWWQLRNSKLATLGPRMYVQIVVARVSTGSSGGSSGGATPTGNEVYLGLLRLEVRVSGIRSIGGGQCAVDFFLHATGGTGFYSYYHDKDVEDPNFKIVDRHPGDYVWSKQVSNGWGGPVGFIVWSGFQRPQRATASAWVDAKQVVCR